MADGHLFNNISLGGRGGTNPGQLRVQSGGILWKKLGGGKGVEVGKSDVVSLTWMKVPPDKSAWSTDKGWSVLQIRWFHDHHGLLYEQCYMDLKTRLDNLNH